MEAYWYNRYQWCLAFGFSYQKVINWEESPLRNSRERTVALQTLDLHLLQPIHLVLAYLL
jgi:hypothetical protein